MAGADQVHGEVRRDPREGNETKENEHLAVQLTKFLAEQIRMGSETERATGDFGILQRAIEELRQLTRDTRSGNSAARPDECMYAFALIADKLRFSSERLDGMLTTIATRVKTQQEMARPLLRDVGAIVFPDAEKPSAHQFSEFLSYARKQLGRLPDTFLPLRSTAGTLEVLQKERDPREQKRLMGILVADMGERLQEVMLTREEAKMDQTLYAGDAILADDFDQHAADAGRIFYEMLLAEETIDEQVARLERGTMKVAREQRAGGQAAADARAAESVRDQIGGI